MIILLSRLLFEKLYSGRVSTRLITHNFYRKAEREGGRERERGSWIDVGICYNEWVFATVANTRW